MIAFAIWFRDTRKAKICAIIFGAITLTALIIGVFFGVRDLYIRRNYQQVTAVVTNNFISQDRRTSWTDTEFKLGGQTYTVRHNLFWIRGRQVELLVNTNNPQQAIPATSLGVFSLIAAVGAGVFGLAFLLYLANFLVCRKRDRKDTTRSTME